MYQGKPIIGIIGGIGSGKSHVAGLFGRLGCLVISSDDQVKQAYALPEVKQALRQWWGEGVFEPSGEVDRKTVAHKVFADEQERRRLEGLLHPLVGKMRDQLMRERACDPQVVAFIWDTPLLVETGLDRQCDAVVFVDAPVEVRVARVRERGWGAAELVRREKSQMPLDRKRQIADYVVCNTDDADVDGRVRSILRQVLCGVGV